MPRGFAALWPAPDARRPPREGKTHARRAGRTAACAKTQKREGCAPAAPTGAGEYPALCKAKQSTGAKRQSPRRKSLFAHTFTGYCASFHTFLQLLYSERIIPYAGLFCKGALAQRNGLEYHKIPARKRRAGKRRQSGLRHAGAGGTKNAGGSGMADVDMKSWVRAFEGQMKAEFGGRVCFLGLQGSRARGEAHAGSDIDVVAILDKVSLDELARYRAVLEKLPHCELACGFISGKEELCRWEPSELLQFYFDTVPVCGTLDFLRPALTPQAAQHAVLSGACSIYHACVHNYVHAHSGEALRGLCKTALFVLRAQNYYETGVFLRTGCELEAALDGQAACVLCGTQAFAAGTAGFEETCGLLLNWTGGLIRRYGEAPQVP